MIRLRPLRSRYGLATISTGLVLLIIMIWGLPHPRLVQTFVVGSPVYSVVIDTETGVLAASSQDDTIHVWSLETMTLQHTLRHYPCVTGNIAMHPNGQQLAVGYGNGAVLLWDVATGTVVRPLREVQPISPGASNRCTADDGNDIRKVRTLAFSPNGADLAVYPQRGPIQLIETATGTLQQELPDPSLVWHLVFSPDGTLLASTGATDISIWNTATGHLDMVLDGPDWRYYVDTMLFIDDGKQLLVGQSRGSRMETWSLATGQIVDHRSVMEAGSGVWALSEQGDIFAAGGKGSHGFFFNSGLPFWGGRADPKIYVGPLHVSAHPHTLWGHRDYVSDLAFSADGRLLVSGSRDGTVRLWRVPEFSR